MIKPIDTMNPLIGESSVARNRTRSKVNPNAPTSNTAVTRPKMYNSKLWPPIPAMATIHQTA